MSRFSPWIKFLIAGLAPLGIFVADAAGANKLCFSFFDLGGCTRILPLPLLSIATFIFLAWRISKFQPPSREFSFNKGIYIAAAFLILFAVPLSPYIAGNILKNAYTKWHADNQALLRENIDLLDFSLSPTFTQDGKIEAVAYKLELTSQPVGQITITFWSIAGSYVPQMYCNQQASSSNGPSWFVNLIIDEPARITCEGKNSFPYAQEPPVSILRPQVIIKQDAVFISVLEGFHLPSNLGENYIGKSAHFVIEDLLADQKIPQYLEVGGGENLSN